MDETPEQPRISPLPAREWPAAMRDAMAAFRPANPRHPLPSQDADRPKGRNALGTLANHPELTHAFNTFNGHVLFSTTLSPRDREVLVLRVAAVRQADYEWAQHVVLSADAGVMAHEVEMIAEGPDASGWSDFDRAMVRAVDELIHGAKISDATWTVLAEKFDTRQLMDLVFTVGAYDLLAMAFLSFGVQLDEDLRRGNGVLPKRDP